MNNPEPFMPRPHLAQDRRAELVESLQHGIDRSIALAHGLSADPLVGSEARSLASRLETIRAEVDLIAAHPWQLRADNDRALGEFSLWG